VYQRLLWDTAAVIDAQAGEVRDRIFSHPLARPDGLQRLLEKAGFDGVARHSVTIRMDFASFDD
jgi:hypothetical protein